MTVAKIPIGLWRVHGATCASLVGKGLTVSVLDLAVQGAVLAIAGPHAISASATDSRQTAGNYKWQRTLIRMQVELRMVTR